MDEKEQIEKRKAFLQNAIDNCNKNIQKSQERMKGVPEDSYAYDSSKRNISRLERTIAEYQSQLKYIRPNNEEDMSIRRQLTTKFKDAIKELYPDKYPIAFHGCDSLGKIEQILKSGGLLTPEQRGVDFESFATGIDVTYKDNIRVSCEFAEPEVHGGVYLPYGAIFAVKPKADEVERVVNTGDSSEVEIGIDGVNFREEPDRLVGIITTEENVERIKGWCKQYGIDESRVQTHKEFLEKQAEELDEKEGGENARMWKYKNLIMFNNEAPKKSLDTEPEKQIGISRENHH